VPKYKVVSVIEHNEKQYWPEPPVGAPPAPKEAPGFGSGRPVPVDASGSLELSEAEAAHLLRGGALEPMRQPAPEKKKNAGAAPRGRPEE